MTLPISTVIPTVNRAVTLRRTLESLREQQILPAELIVVDGSKNNDSRNVVEQWARGLQSQCAVIWHQATQLGAAVQRNHGVTAATQPYIWFIDDDILFEAKCMSRLWRALTSDSRLGGVNAMIINQRYQRPGLISRLLFTLMHGRREHSFAGRVIGPAINLLPEDRNDLPEIVPVEWLNTTCALYRREALPSPAFDSMFTGYSLMEDLALSLKVGRSWKLANARTARIYHDSQPADYKDNKFARAKMELINRHYVMTHILERSHLSDYLKLLLLEFFGIATSLATSREWSTLPAVLFGKVAAVGTIITTKTPA
jgi:GT2 family glycosyltransferase